MFSTDSVVTTLSAVGKIPELIRASKSDSLVEYARVTRVEPICLLDQSVIHLPFIHDIQQSLLNMMAGYYLQAVSLTMNVGKVDVIKLLDKVNPNRDPSENAGALIGDIAGVAMLSMESYKYRLPKPQHNVSLEASHDAIQDGVQNAINNYGTDLPPGSSQGLGRDTVKLVQEVANLSVGKLLEVHVESCGSKATFPVSIRLIASAIAADNLTHILSVGGKDTSVKERYHAWRAGQLTFIKDLILCQDLIDDHRMAIMNDKSGVYADMLARKNRNKLSAILSGQPSIATASNMVVMAKSTADKIENTLHGRLKDFRFRENIFKTTYLMIMVVVDPAYEQVTIYTRSIDQATHCSVKELKSSNSKGGPDIAEILNAYKLGQSPSI